VLFRSVRSQADTDSIEMIDREIEQIDQQLDTIRLREMLNED